MSLQYMTGERYAAIAAARSFAELAAVACSILEEMNGEVGMVCGPISTGGVGSVKGNLLQFNKAIETLEHHGCRIFDQMPFEDAIQRLKDPTAEYDDRILTEFYATVFATGKITVQYFMHNWRSSRGARWEREQALTRGVRIIDLDEQHRPVAET